MTQHRAAASFRWEPVTSSHVRELPGLRWHIAASTIPSVEMENVYRASQLVWTWKVPWENESAPNSSYSPATA